MRILHVINSLHFGGAEKLLVDSLPIYKKNKNDISVLLLNADKTPFYIDLKNKGIDILEVNTLNNLYNPLYILKIHKHIKKFDIVHVHLFPAVYWVSLACLFNRNIKLILTEHNTENRRRKIILFKYLDRIIYKRYNSIIAISKGTYNSLKKHLGKSYNNISIINNGIDIESIEKSTPYSNKEFAFSNSTKIIIQVSSFTNQKDQKTLIRAMSFMPDNVKLILVGDGPLKPICENLSKSLNLDNKILFLGLRNDVPKLVKTAYISVLSSHYEGFGLAIVEGMAAKNACVGSHVDGMAEILSGSGILFEKGNYLDLKDKLLELIHDDNYYNQISQKCYKKSKEFDINFMVDKYINVYKQK